MTLLIEFTDGTKRRIENVKVHNLFESLNCFVYSTENNSSWGFVPKEVVRYFGPEELWGMSEKKAYTEDSAIDNFVKILLEKIKSRTWRGPEDDFVKGYNKGLRDAMRVIDKCTKEI